MFSWVFSGDSYGKEFACETGDPGSIPGLGRPHGGGNDNPLQYSCLENSNSTGQSKHSLPTTQDSIHDIT